MSEPTLADVLDALRKVYAKLLEIEARLPPPPAPRPAQQQLVPAPKKGKPDPKHALLRGHLMRVWAKVKGNNYPFDGKDARAIASLLRRSIAIEEIVARWERAVADGCASMYLFDLNFAKYAPSVTNTRPVVGSGDVYGDQT